MILQNKLTPMKTLFTLLAICLSTHMLSAQTTTDFENFNLPVDSFLNGSDGSGGFRSGNVFLPNSNFGSFWSGWAISAARDVTTPGFMNQYSVISGSGYDGSDSYALTFIFEESILHLEGAAAGGVVEGMYINNGTYPYFSMLEGDGFAKKFGGETGDDPDFLLVTIKKYYNGQLSTDSVNFYLGDYRFSDNSQDYIVKDWTYVDLTSLGNVDSLSFSVSGSDVGMNGLNSPAYCFIDNITTRDMTSSIGGAFADLALAVYPNPAVEVLSFDWPQSEQGQLKVFDLQGRQMVEQVLQNGSNRITVNDWPTGTYVLWIQVEGEWGSQLFSVQR